MADELEELTEEYDGVLEAVRQSPDDEELRARKAELAERIVEVRRAEREQREAEALSLSDGAGVARPAPVEGTSGVNE